MARPTVAKRAQVAARRAQAIRLQLAGHTWAEIAERLGYRSAANACEDVRRALAEAKAEQDLAADELRMVEVARLDALTQQAWTVMEREHVTVSHGKVIRRQVGWELDEDGTRLLNADGEPIPMYEDLLDDAPVLQAIDRLLRIGERRAKLLGLDAPARVSVEAETLGQEIGELLAAIGGAGEHADS